jgi:hypothetical protein
VDAATYCDFDSTYDRNQDDNWVSGPICEAGEFALFGEREYWIYLPVVMKE